MRAFFWVKGINIVIGCICLGLGSHLYSETYYITVPDIDVIFLIVVASAIVESIIALLTAYNYKDVQYRYPIIDTIQRGIISVAVLVAGGLLIYSAYQIEDDCSHLKIITTKRYSNYNYCQSFEAALTAGILCVINGVFHGIAKKDLGQACISDGCCYASAAPNYPGGAPSNYPGGVPPNFTNSRIQQVPLGPTIISQNTSYTNPSGYHEPNIQIPRFQTQDISGYQYNQNYNQNQMQNQMPVNYSQPQQQRY